MDETFLFAYASCDETQEVFIHSFLQARILTYKQLSMSAGPRDHIEWSPLDYDVFEQAHFSPHFIAVEDILSFPIKYISPSSCSLDSLYARESLGNTWFYCGFAPNGLEKLASALKKPILYPDVPKDRLILP